MIGKKKADESKEMDEIPGKAGAPNMTVRKTWSVGHFSVTLEGGQISICDERSPTSGLYNSLTIRKEYAAAIADALLQAS